MRDLPNSTHYLAIYREWRRLGEGPLRARGKVAFTIFHNAVSPAPGAHPPRNGDVRWAESFVKTLPARLRRKTLAYKLYVENVLPMSPK